MNDQQPTRRGFLGLLGIATAMTAVPIGTAATALSKGASVGKQKGRPSHKQVIFKTSDRNVIHGGDRLYSERVQIEVTPLRRGRVQMTTVVTVGPQTEWSADEDFVGIAEEDMVRSGYCELTSAGIGGPIRPALKPKGTLYGIFNDEEAQVGNHT